MLLSDVLVEAMFGYILLAIARSASLRPHSFQSRLARHCPHRVGLGYRSHARATNLPPRHVPSAVAGSVVAASICGLRRHCCCEASSPCVRAQKSRNQKKQVQTVHDAKRTPAANIKAQDPPTHPAQSLDHFTVKAMGHRTAFPSSLPMEKRLWRKRGRVAIRLARFMRAAGCRQQAGVLGSMLSFATSCSSGRCQ